MKYSFASTSTSTSTAEQRRDISINYKQQTMAITMTMKVAYIKYRILNIEHRTSNIQHRISNIEQWKVKWVKVLKSEYQMVGEWMNEWIRNETLHIFIKIHATLRVLRVPFGGMKIGWFMFHVGYSSVHMLVFVHMVSMVATLNIE